MRTPGHEVSKIEEVLFSPTYKLCQIFSVINGMMGWGVTKQFLQNTNCFQKPI